MGMPEAVLMTIKVSNRRLTIVLDSLPGLLLLPSSRNSREDFSKDDLVCDSVK